MFIRILRSNLDIENAKQVFDAYREIKEFESKNAFIDRLISANESIFKEVIGMSENALVDRIVMAIAENRGWLDKEKNDFTDKFFMDIAYRKNMEKIAQGLKQDNIPLHIIVKNTGLTLQEVEAL